MIKIGIIGGGFSGIMTAVNLIIKAETPIEINIIDKSESIVTGIAYNPYSEKHLLNVSTGKMSAFPDDPDHFLNWVLKRSEYLGIDKELIRYSFLPRFVYGDYLKSIWNEYRDKKNFIKVNTITGTVKNLSR
jgi:uncharacterized NAD(P)/FAD-binding protein YdhS